MSNCLRCGSCCREYFAMIPKNEDSDLSNKNIEEIFKISGLSGLNAYLNNNAVEMDKKCRWLEQESHINEDGKNSVAKCLAYNRKSEQCDSYCGKSYQWCNVGLYVWEMHKKNGYEIPEEIMEIIKKHPVYRVAFKEKE